MLALHFFRSRDSKEFEYGPGTLPARAILCTSAHLRPGAQTALVMIPTSCSATVKSKLRRFLSTAAAVPVAVSA
jgi:hypothetical protein